MVSADNHAFVGRIYDLSIVGLWFDSYEDMAVHADALYALTVNETVSALTRRVESLNLVGDMLWPTSDSLVGLPVSKYEWLLISADVFLVRYVSVVDCALLVVGAVFETNLPAEKCSAANLKKAGVPERVLDIAETLRQSQRALRTERNRRFHHGVERALSSHDDAFRFMARFESAGRGSGARDERGKTITLDRLFSEGAAQLQRQFNPALRQLSRELRSLYDALHPEFERRFKPKFRAGAFAATGKLERSASP